ncbi:unnamed protein product, partial [Closterium sp. NIES-53]
ACHAVRCGMAGRWSDLDVCQEFSMGEILRNDVDVRRISPMLNSTESPPFGMQVRAMASLRHEHVVRLLGFCLHQNVESGQQEQILVYKFVPNGDLKYHIHDSKTPLTLKQRLQLAVGAAEGVAYLHSFATPIVHRDLKPGNILVGEHNQAKIADFGLLKLLSHAEGGHDRTRVAGTPGYVDPDYNRTQVVSEKSDVYSFGVVLLELLTRQKAAVEGTDSHISDWVISFPLLHLPDSSQAERKVQVYELAVSQSSLVLSPHLPYSQAARKVQVYSLGELKDAGLEAPDEAVVELADIALDCLKMPASRRPPIKDVARRLQNLLSLYCEDDDHSAVVEPSLRMEGGGVRGDGGSTDTFGRSEWSEGTSGASASKSLTHSLWTGRCSGWQERWQMQQRQVQRWQMQRRKGHRRQVQRWRQLLSGGMRGGATRKEERERGELHNGQEEREAQHLRQRQEVVVDMGGRRAHGAAPGRRGCPNDQVTRRRDSAEVRDDRQGSYGEADLGGDIPSDVADQVLTLSRGRFGVCSVHVTGHNSPTRCKHLRSGCAVVMRVQRYAATMLQRWHAVDLQRWQAATLHCWSAVDLAVLERGRPCCAGG